MDLRVLRYAVAVADRLNFTAAARALNVSQPALSQQIRLLENELGVTIFSRSSQAVAVTQAGRLVVDHARRVLGTAATLRDEVEAFRGARRGRLRMGVTQSFNALHLPPVLSSFLSDHAGIDVTVRELPNPAIVEGVAAGALDIGVAFDAGGDDAVAARPLYEDRLMLAYPAGHRLAGVSPVPLAALARETLALLPDDFATRRELDLFLSLHDVVPARIVVLNTFAAIIGLVAEGGCLSVIPTWPSAADGAGRVQFAPLRPSPARRTTSIVLPPGGTHTPAAQAMAEQLRARFRPAD